MFFINYIEIDYEYAYNSTLSSINSKKQLTNISNLNGFSIELSFFFNKVVEVDVCKIYNYIFLLWLITGELAIIKKYTSELVLGIKYYNVFLNLRLNDTSLFGFLDFLINGWLPVIKSNSINFSYNTKSVYCYITTFDIFNNIRLSYNTFLYSLSNKLVIEFKDFDDIVKNKLNLFKLI